MDRKRNIGNRNRPQRNQRTQKGLSNRRARLDRRNRRQGIRPNRNRLSRVQNNVSRNRRGVFRNRRRFNNFRRRRNLRYKIIFVGNLPFDVKEESSKRQLLEEDMDQKDMALWSFIIREMLGDRFKSGIKPL